MMKKGNIFFIICVVALSWLVLGTSCNASEAAPVPKETQVKTGEQVEGAASEPEAVSVAEPNIGALLGIGTLGANQGLLAGFNGARSIPGAAGLNLGASPIPGGVPDLRSLCSNNGNADPLTNLLVYQYLSGGLPNGGGLPKVNGPAAASNPHLQALLDNDAGYKTSTTVTTGLTTRTVSLEPTTHFSTSTSVYVTTITAVSTKILPVVFRGNTITTTITDRKTEVLTATEFTTSSSVTNPSIVEKLPLEITLVHKSTLGLNGRYTLDHVAPGATRVIEKPISTQAFGFKNQQGIDLSSIDFSSVDLKGLNGGDSDMLNALSALLEQYSDGPREPKRNDRYQLRREKPRQSRFQERDRLDGLGEDPKISVIKGFTLRDREQRPPKKESSSSGTAALNTRYAKFLKKGKLKNNSLQPQEPDRESEPFSASTSRRTVSSQRRRDVPPHAFGRRNRFQQPTGRSVSSGRSPTSQRERQFAVRRNRQIPDRTFRRRQGRTLDTDTNDEEIKVIAPRRSFNAIHDHQIKTTTAVLTLRLHGAHVYRTITLGTLDPTLRLRRHISVIDPSPLQKMSQTESVILPNMEDLKPEHVVELLRKVDKKSVQVMLSSLKNWVEYYMREVLDDGLPNASVFSKEHKDIETNQIPELTSSLVREEPKYEQPEYTDALPAIPEEVTKDPSVGVSSSSLCLDSQTTLTTTVYKTVYLSQP